MVNNDLILKYIHHFMDEFLVGKGQRCMVNNATGQILCSLGDLVHQIPHRSMSDSPVSWHRSRSVLPCDRSTDASHHRLQTS